MYMKPQQDNSLLLPQYMLSEKEAEEKLVSKFNLIDLAGSERITEAEKNLERIDEARFINKSLAALGNVVAALRTQAKQGNDTTTNKSKFHQQQQYNRSRGSSFQSINSPSPMHMMPGGTGFSDLAN